MAPETGTVVRQAGGKVAASGGKEMLAACFDQ